MKNIKINLSPRELGKLEDEGIVRIQLSKEELLELSCFEEDEKDHEPRFPRTEEEEEFNRQAAMGKKFTLSDNKNDDDL